MSNLFYSTNGQIFRTNIIENFQMELQTQIK